MNHFKKLPRSWSTELNLRYEFSSRKIPITDSTKEQEKRESEQVNVNARLSGEESFDERTNIPPLPAEVEYSPTESLEKIARLHFFN